MEKPAAIGLSEILVPRVLDVMHPGRVYVRTLNIGDKDVKTSLFWKANGKKIKDLSVTLAPGEDRMIPLELKGLPEGEICLEVSYFHEEWEMYRQSIVDVRGMFSPKGDIPPRQNLSVFKRTILKGLTNLALKNEALFEDMQKAEQRHERGMLRSVFDRSSLQRRYVGLLREAERLFCFGPRARGCSLFGTLPNGSGAWMSFDSEGLVPNGLRKVTGPSLRSFICREIMWPSLAFPVERTLKDAHSALELAQQLTASGEPGYELGGFYDLLGNGLNTLIYGGKGVGTAHSRGSSTRASEERLKTITRMMVWITDLSDPGTWPQEAILDRGKALWAYVKRWVDLCGGTPVLKEDGSLDVEGTWSKEFAPLTSKERKAKLGLKSLVGGKPTSNPVEVDGESICSEDVMEILGSKLGGIQFRATPMIPGSEMKELLKIAIEGRYRQLYEGVGTKEATKWTTEMVDKLVSEGKVHESGLYKGLLRGEDIAGSLKPGTILIDINCVKGRDKAAIKDAIKRGEFPKKECAIGVVATLEDKGLVSFGWQAFFLIGEGTLEGVSRDAALLIEKGIREMLQGTLPPYMVNILLSSELKEEDEEEDEEEESKDILEGVLKNWDALIGRGVNFMRHPGFLKLVRNKVVYSLIKGKFGLLPKGSNQPKAQRQYLYSAIDCPWAGRIRVEDKDGVKEILATACYVSDPSYWGKIGLTFRYPILKETTIIPCIFLKPPEERMRGEESTLAIGMNEMAIKVLLVGDTDGDQGSLCLFALNGVESSSYKLTHNGQFVMNLKRSEGKDDWALLKAFASILECRDRRPKAQDPAEWLDRKADYAKQPLEIPWEDVGEAWYKGELSRSGVGSVALGYQATVRLWNEIEALENLIHRGSHRFVGGLLRCSCGRTNPIFAIECSSCKKELTKDSFEESEGILEKRDKKEFRPDKMAMMVRFVREVKALLTHLWAWSALMGEASVCGVKYDTSKAALVGLGEMTHHTSDIVKGVWCDDCFEHRCKKCPVSQGERLDLFRWCNQCWAKKCSSCPVLRVKELDSKVKEGKEMAREDLKVLPDIYTVLLHTVVKKIDSIRWILSWKTIIRKMVGVEERILWNCSEAWEKDSNGNLLPEYQDLRDEIQRANKIGWSPKDSNGRMSSRPSGRVIIEGLSNGSVEEELKPLYTEPNLLCDPTSKVVEAKRGVLTRMLRLTQTNLRKTKSKAGRLNWSDIFASRNEEGEVVRTDQLGLSGTEIWTVGEFLQGHTIILNNRIRPTYKLMDEAWKRRKASSRWVVQQFRKTLDDCLTYGDLRVAYRILVWAFGKKLDFSKVTIDRENAYIPDQYLRPVNVERLIEGGDFSWRPRMEERDAMLEEFISAEEKLWKTYYSEGFLPLFDAWAEKASKEEIELLWRDGHSLMEEDEFAYEYGQTLALRGMGFHLGKFVGTCKMEVKAQEVVGPVVIGSNPPNRDIPPKVGDEVLISSIPSSKAGNETSLFIEMKGQDNTWFIKKSKGFGGGKALKDVVEWNLEAQWGPLHYVVEGVERERYAVDTRYGKKGEPTWDTRSWIGNPRQCWVVHLRLKE